MASRPRAHYVDFVTIPTTVTTPTGSAQALIVAASATCNVYQPGTTTAVTQTLYSAATGGTTLANPLTASAAGKVEFWSDEPFTADLRVSGTGLTTTTFSIEVIESGQEADRELTNVKAYGALGDGSIDDTTAIQAAIDAASTAPRGGMVLIPAGTYVISATLTLKNKPVILMGEGGVSSTYSSGDRVRDSATILKTTANIPVIHIFEDDYTVIESIGSSVRDLAILGNRTGTSQRGVWVDSRNNCSALNVMVSGMGGDGFYLTDSVGGYFSNCVSNHNVSDGYELNASAGTAGATASITNNVFVSCTALGNDSDGWDVGPGSNGTIWEGCTAESNAAYGWAFSGTAPAICRGNTGFGNWDESNTLGGVRYADTNCYANTIGLAKVSSNPVVSYAAGAHRLNGVRVETSVSADANFPDGLPAWKLARLLGALTTASDVDHVATRLYDNSDDGTHRADRFISSAGLTLAATDITPTSHQISAAYVMGNNQSFKAAKQAGGGASVTCFSVSTADIVGLGAGAPAVRADVPFIAAGPTTLSGATPSVAAGNVFNVTNGGATTITDFTGGQAGQTITLIFTDANTTVTDGGNIALSGAFTSSADDVMVLVTANGTAWKEQSRSVN